LVDESGGLKNLARSGRIWGEPAPVKIFANLKDQLVERTAVPATRLPQQQGQIVWIGLPSHSVLLPYNRPIEQSARMVGIIQLRHITPKRRGQI